MSERIRAGAKEKAALEKAIDYLVDHSGYVLGGGFVFGPLCVAAVIFSAQEWHRVPWAFFCSTLGLILVGLSLICAWKLQQSIIDFFGSGEEKTDSIRVLGVFYDSWIGKAKVIYTLLLAGMALTLMGSAIAAVPHWFAEPDSGSDWIERRTF